MDCCSALLIVACIVGQILTGQVAVTGAMRKTMWEGQLAGLIALDSVAKPDDGIGPLEFLRGEIMLVEGIAPRSTAVTDSTMRVEERSHVSAVFCSRTGARLDPCATSSGGGGSWPRSMPSLLAGPRIVQHPSRSDSWADHGKRIST